MAKMESSSRQLTMKNIQELDKGRVALAVNQAIRQCVLDIDDRPADKSKRKVQLIIELEPELDKDTAALDTIGVGFQVQTKLPVRKSHIYPMAPTAGGAVVFQPASPFDPRQESLFPKQEPTPAVAQEHVNKDTGEVTDFEDAADTEGDLDDDVAPDESAM